MATSLDEKNKWEVALTNVNLSKIELFEAMLEASKSMVKDIKEMWAEEIPADDITALMEAMDSLVDDQAELLMYLRMEILESNQKSIKIRRLNRKIKALESTSLN